MYLLFPTTCLTAGHRIWQNPLDDTTPITVFCIYGQITVPAGILNSYNSFYELTFNYEGLTPRQLQDSSNPYHSKMITGMCSITPSGHIKLRCPVHFFELLTHFIQIKGQKLTIPLPSSISIPSKETLPSIIALAESLGLKKDLLDQLPEWLSSIESEIVSEAFFTERENFSELQIITPSHPIKKRVPTKSSDHKSSCTIF